MVEPTLNIAGGLVLFIGDGADLTMDFSVNNGDENKETHSKGKGDGIAKDRLGTSKQCQTMQGKNKGLETLNNKVSTDVVELWNELTNGSRSSNSLAKVDVTLVVQNIGRNTKSPAKGFRLVGQATSCNASQMNKF
jgi:hypothetical protein